MDNASAAKALKAIAEPEDLILLKGSNGMHLNEIIGILAGGADGTCPRE